jgi:hypothetical protein
MFPTIVDVPGILNNLVVPYIYIYEWNKSRNITLKNDVIWFKRIEIYDAVHVYFHSPAQWR